MCIRDRAHPDLFANTPEERFLERKAAIGTELEEADDFTFALELQSLTALAGDSHTCLLYTSELAEGEVPEQDAAEPEEPGLWDRLLTLVGLRKPEEPREEPQPYRLPTAEELLGEMCRDLDIKGQGLSLIHI